MATIGDFKMYHYRAIVRKVRDGDSIVAEINFGGPHRLREDWPIRILGYDAAEVVGKYKAEGLRATVALTEMIPLGTRVYIETKLDRTNFDRLLAWVYVEGADGSLYGVHEAMIAGGFDFHESAATGWSQLLERSSTTDGIRRVREKV